MDTNNTRQWIFLFMKKHDFIQSNIDEKRRVHSIISYLCSRNWEYNDNSCSVTHNHSIQNWYHFSALTVLIFTSSNNEIPV